MAENVVAVSPNIEGNITSCKVENVLLTKIKNSAFSFTETETFVTYDVCNKQEMARYNVPEITEIGAICVFFGIVFVIILFAALISWIAD